MLVRRRLIQLAVASSAGIVLGGLVGGGVVAGTFESRFYERFYPGVSVGRIDLDGLSWGDAVARVENRWRPLIYKPIVIRSGGQEWRPTGAQIGLEVDYITPLHHAYAWGRNGGITKRASQQVSALRFGRDWDVIVTFDRNKFAAYVTELLLGMDRRAVPANVAIVGSPGSRNFVVRPSVSGQSIVGVDALLSFDPEFDSPGTQFFELKVETVPPQSTTAEMLEVIRDAERLTSGQLSIHGSGQTWNIDRALLRDRMKLVEGPDGASLVFPVEMRDFEEFVQGVASQLYVEPIEPKLKFDVESGDLRHLTPGVAGARVDIIEFQARIRSGLLGSTKSISVPMRTVQPKLERATVSSLGLNSVFGIGESFFIGSAADRIQNILVGSAKLDGVVIAPGETFDFNESLGAIDRGAGFVDGLIITNNRTIVGVGGGICQVSTTMFRAAFLAGLPVTERWQHFYRVGYYELGENAPPGFDASIYQPDLNLKFVNDTDYFLMIRTEFDPDVQRLRVLLKGHGPARQVVVSSWHDEPIPPPPARIVANADLKPGEKKQTDYAIWGMNAGISRKVWAHAQLVIEDEFKSLFQPWAARWEIGPDALGNLDTSDIEGAD